MYLKELRSLPRLPTHQAIVCSICVAFGVPENTHPRQIFLTPSLSALVAFYLLPGHCPTLSWHYLTWTPWISLYHQPIGANNNNHHHFLPWVKPAAPLVFDPKPLRIPKFMLPLGPKHLRTLLRPFKSRQSIYSPFPTQVRSILAALTNLPPNHPLSSLSTRVHCHACKDRRPSFRSCKMLAFTCGPASVGCYPPQTLLLPGLTDQQAILVAPLYGEKIRSHFVGRNVFHGEKNNIPLDTVEDRFQQKIALDRWRVNWNGSRKKTKSRGYDHASDGPSGPIPSK